MFDFSDGLRRLLRQRLINLFWHWPKAFLANLYYRFPARRLTVVGVTGTDGKTTTVHLIQAILNQAGQTAAMISSLGAGIARQTLDTGFHVTSPDPILLQHLLRKMVKAGVRYVVLEVTSHGLDQYRFGGVKFQVGVLTNVTREHLDYHRDFLAYRLAKLKLLTSSEVAVLNQDDKSFAFLSHRLAKRRIKTVTYAVHAPAQYTPRSFPFQTRLPGEYNRYNVLAAIAAGKVLGIGDEVIRQALTDFPGVEGRMEEVANDKQLRIIIDFAHTPNALKQMLTTVKSVKSSTARLWVVFGAAGRRDQGKRALMGEIAGRYADEVVLTAEDPRTESVTDICAQISAGCAQAGRSAVVIEDRQKAIDYALNHARPEDVVVIAGKGHERSMCFGEREYPWSDRQAVNRSLAGRKARR